jgi:hypothetical protein
MPFTFFADQRSAIVEGADAVGKPVEFLPDAPQLPPTFRFGCLIFEKMDHLSIETAPIPLRFPLDDSDNWLGNVLQSDIHATILEPFAHTAQLRLVAAPN